MEQRPFDEAEHWCALARTPPTTERLCAFRLLTYYDQARLHLGALVDTLPFAKLTEHPKLVAEVESVVSPERKPHRKEKLRIDDKQRMCKGCRNIFLLDEFVGSYCRACHYAYLKHRQSNHPSGYLSQLVCHCHSDDKKHQRICEGAPYTREYVVQLFKLQRGLCYYSNAPLSFEPGSNFCVTIERRDNKFGHVPGNVVLVCNRFQSGDGSKHTVHGQSAQWSRGKFFEAKRLRHSYVDNTVPLHCDRKTPRRKRKFEHCDGQWKCTDCGIFKGSDDFGIGSKSKHGINSKCKACTAIQAKESRCDHVQLLQSRRLDAKRRATRKNVPYGLQGHERSDTLLRAMWNQQQGRGIYTRVPLCCTPTHDWVVSLERLEKEKGYVPGNIALEVFEANTAKQWTREFADALWGPCG